MKLPFYKYQGTGNDFIMIDNRQRTFDETNNKLVNKLCDRRFGIGGDGLILLQDHPDYDFEMVYFNADGNTSSMCGNGGRCIVAFAAFLGVIKDSATFLAADGPHEAYIDDNIVHLKMKDVDDVETQNGHYFTNTGSPHYIAFVENVETLDVYAHGKEIRYSDRFFCEGTNVNFVEKQNINSLFVRTYERGVEDETFSCGTGVTAAALAAALEGAQSPLGIRTLGGDLQVSFERTGEHTFRSIFLIGPAEQVFQGSISIAQYAGTQEATV
jgi:diaminopimelate epimerase